MPRSLVLQSRAGTLQTVQQSGSSQHLVTDAEGQILRLSQPEATNSTADQLMYPHRNLCCYLAEALVAIDRMMHRDRVTLGCSAVLQTNI